MADVRKSLYRVLVILLTCLGAAVPARAQFAVQSELIQEVALAPGQRHADAIQVANTSEEPLEIVLYQKDHQLSADRGFVEPDPGTLERSNAPWIVLPTSRMVVPPGETFDFSYEIVVPPSVAPEGTYWSMIYVESEKPPGADDGAGALQISFGSRFGIQMITHVGGGALDVAFDAPQLTAADDGRRTFEVDVANVGTRMGKPAVWVELYDAQGALFKRFDGYGYRLYPGSSARQRIDLGTVPPGEYTVLVVADGGEDAFFGAQYSLTF